MDLNAKSEETMSDRALIGQILHSLQAKLKDLDIKLNIIRKGSQQLAKSDTKIAPLNDTEVTSFGLLVIVLQRGSLSAEDPKFKIRCTHARITRDGF